MALKHTLAALCLCALAAAGNALRADANSFAAVSSAATGAMQVPPQFSDFAGAIYAHTFSLEMDDHFETLGNIGVSDAGGQCLEWKLLDKWSRKKETYGAVYHNAQLDTLVFTFRGTKNFRNVITDIDAVEKSCQYNNVSCGRIHVGFSASYDEIRADVLATIRSFDRPQHIVFAGHSLGGALGTIGTIDVLTNGSLLDRVASVSLFTTGSPQVGNKDLASTFQSLGANSIRTVQKGVGSDPVTELPGTLGTILAASYKHIQDPVDVQCPRAESTATIKCFLGDLHNPILYFGAMKKKLPAAARIGLCDAL